MLAVLVVAGRGLSAGAGASPAGALTHLAGHADRAPALSTVSATVLWNGWNVADASSPANAFAIGPGQSADIQFEFTLTPGTPRVTNASLSLLFLGVTLSTEALQPVENSSHGSGEMNWTFGSLIYLTEGVYEVDAELSDANGTVLFEQAFYVDAQAPYVLGSAIALFAVVLGAVESYWIAAVIRWRHRGRRGYRSR